jgi:GTPase SAR1 family protein
VADDDRPAVPAERSQQDAVEHKAAEERVTNLRTAERDLLAKLDEAINILQRKRPSDEVREHLEILRGLLKAQTTAYLTHFSTNKATLFTQTSTMYASEVGTPGVISTTLRGLIEGRTVTGGQATKLAQFIAGRRTIVIFGDRATGKSTLLNSLFELVSVDERFVAVERTQDLPALKERSFCVRLGVDDKTDLAPLFGKAQRMQPGRLVVGEMHGEEINHFFYLLQRDPKIGGFATMRADTVHNAIEHITKTLAKTLDPGAVKALIAEVAPAFVHMHSDENGRPRLAAIWSVEGLDGEGEIILMEETTKASAAAELPAEA